MRRGARIAAATAAAWTLAGPAGWLGVTPPTAAGADPAVTVTSSGTTVTVAIAAEGTFTFTCDPTGHDVRVVGTPASPPVPCATLTRVEVSADGNRHTIDARGLDDPAFAAAPSVGIVGGTGPDVIYGTSRTDSLRGGPSGDDVVHAQAGPNPDGPISGQTVIVDGTAGHDTLALVQATNVWLPSDYYDVVTWSSAAGTSATGRIDANAIIVRGLQGNDALNAFDGYCYNSLNAVRLEGGPGDDRLSGGTNLQLVQAGGPGADELVGSPSNGHFEIDGADVVHGAGGWDAVTDRDAAHIGGATLEADGTTYEYRVWPTGDVGTLRIRPTNADGSGRVTASGNRSGVQALGPSTTSIDVYQGADAGPSDLTLVDAVLSPGRRISLLGVAGHQDLLDVTVPHGTWRREDDPGGHTVVVMPDDDDLATVSASNADEVSVHGPWADVDEGFVHRAIRDLLLTFISDAGRAQRTAALKDGTQTRAGIVDEAMALDAYTGYDVDRAFLRYLGRGADPSGRSYWIRSIRSGKALWRFRAQLIGSNEYFAKAGGTNAAYVARAYGDVLGRTPDPSGLAYWTAKLDRGVDRGSVALQFIDATETRRRAVDDLYRRFLDRLPTAAEQAAGVAVLHQASGEQALVRSLVLSDEYLHSS